MNREYYTCGFENTDLIEKFIPQALRKITFTFCVSSSDFYDTANKLQFSDDELYYDLETDANYDFDDGDIRIYDRREEGLKSNKKLHRIISRLALNEGETETENASFFCAKVFDLRLEEAEAYTYKAVEDMINDSGVADMYSRCGLFAEELEKRTGFAFVEYAALSCLHNALEKSAITVLNTAIDPKKPPKRAKDRFRRIKATLFSERFFCAMVEKVFDLLIEEYREGYEETLEKHLREFWLPEEKRNLKFLDRAINKYVLDEANLPEDEQDEKYIDKSSRFVYQLYDVIMPIQRFFYDLWPLAELIVTDSAFPANVNELITEEERQGKSLFGTEEVMLRQYYLASNRVRASTKRIFSRYPNENMPITLNTYATAVKVAEIVHTYVEGVIRASVMLLECLHESAVAGTNGLWEYLGQI